MPIRPDLRQFYGPEWRNVIRPRILKRAGGQFDGKGRYLGGAKCEQCGKPDRKQVHEKTRPRPCRGLPDPVMLWKPVSYPAYWTRDDRKTFPQITAPSSWPTRTIWCVLTVAHLDHTPGHDEDSNLKALCQWCHLNYDKLHHKETRSERKDAKRPLLQEATLAANRA